MRFFGVFTQLTGFGKKTLEGLPGARFHENPVFHFTNVPKEET